MNELITNVKHVWVELNNLLTQSVSIGSWWWSWNKHLCFKSEPRWWRWNWPLWWINCNRW